MSNTGFTTKDFNVFTIPGLEPRMEALQEQIQPKFKNIGERLVSEISSLTGEEMFLHIAKHLRRTTNPPDDSWLAIAPDKRGYKKHPHFQLGLFDDHLFIWLAFIYELPNKKEIGEAFLNDLNTIKTLPNDFAISTDHTKKSAEQIGDLTESDLEKKVIRFRDVKKGEFLIGQQLTPTDSRVQDEEELIKTAIDTYETLLPLYRKSLTR
ncbi:YktB family protein [Geomicrobium sp. JSM 1781026]|uniref:YktB family protein n=1 Tax=Geomicrobium sp. JSM 1781026 TaxID=3344580 RepID=UPI0035BF80DB